MNFMPMMRVLPLFLKIHPDPILRKVCLPVDTFDGWLADVTHEMLLLMRAHDGIGLAAPQVGLNGRFFIAEIDRQVLCLVNPVIINRGAVYNQMVEGCLSLPGDSYTVDRSSSIDVSGYTLSGEKKVYHFRNLWARVVQHEVDHLDGRMIFDYT